MVPGTDCPYCKASNPPGATSCSTCHRLLASSAATVVADRTPPTGTSAATITDGMASPWVSEIVGDQSTPASMAVPTGWSVPAGGTHAPGGQSAFVTLQPGSLLGNRYEIMDVLGEGGMGAVYKARDRALDRFVAVKVIRPELAGQPEILQRFKQELILARKVTHRNVIRIFDLGEADGIKFITMEFIEGQDLKSVIARNGKLPLERAVSIIQQVCLALEAAHAEGVIHRDLKPQNIMVDQQDRAWVMDFGIARSIEFGGMTQTGALIGTPEYMSPEQVRGEHVDARSDLFTLGIIFQEILTGTLPYQADTAMASMFKRTKERAVSVRQLDPAVPQYLSEIVAKCLEIAPQDRFQTARDLYDALEAWKSGTAAPLRIRSRRWIRRVVRNRVAIGFTAAGAGLAILLMAALFVYRAKYAPQSGAGHATVSVLVADFKNQTGDPIFNGTLEPMCSTALEGASFINSFNRGEARRLASKLPNPSSSLDERAARLVAINQGIGAVVTGSLSKSGSGYELSMHAIDAVTGKTIATSDAKAPNGDKLLLDIPKLVAPIRTALGDTTPESAQLAAEEGAFTTSNLEAVHDYGMGMEQQFSGQWQDALKSFSKAAQLDPNFARAYSGMAAAYENLGNTKAAEQNIKLAMTHVNRMTERERYRIRGLYYVYSGDYSKCIDEYRSLLKLFPADNIAHNNLASCYTALHQYSDAVQEFRRSVEISPHSIGSRMNLSVLSSYTGDFKTAEKQARTVIQSNPSYETAYIALAYAQLGQDQIAQAAKTYQTVGKLSPLGASIRTSGLADIALYEGRYAEAANLLERGAAADLAAKNSRAADKFAMLAYTQLTRGNKAEAIAAAERAVNDSQEANVRFLVARVFAAAGETAKARELSMKLGEELDPEAQADAKLIEGEIALDGKDPRAAIPLFNQANNVLGTWMGWFDLGRAYLEAGFYVEADSEFDHCNRERGQAMDMLDGPTYGYFPPVYYYLGRTEEGLGSSGAANFYRKFVNIRRNGDGGALYQDAERRLAKLTAKK
jgi:tetratricopeptide (TPR) repeat protein/predicted Ser/Thr protein kinase